MRSFTIEKDWTGECDNCGFRCNGSLIKIENKKTCHCTYLCNRCSQKLAWEMAYGSEDD